MNILKLAHAIKERYTTRMNSLEAINFHGRKIKVVRGTVRKKADRDDHWLLILLGQSKLFFDVGANMGYMSVLGFLSNPQRQIFLFEPNKYAMEVAMFNMLYTGNLSMCTFIDSFVGAEDFKETRFYTIGAGAAGSMYKSHAESAAALNSFMMVGTRTLDSVVAQYGVSPDLVKIDVEGAEGLVLDGCINLPTLRSTRFFVEMHSNVDLTMVTNAAKVLDWCKRVNYRAWYLKNEQELHSGEQIAQRGRCHLLLQPMDWDYPEFLRGIKENSPLPNVI